MSHIFLFFVMSGNFWLEARHWHFDVLYTFISPVYPWVFSGKLLKPLWSFQGILLKFIIWEQSTLNLGLIFPKTEAIHHQAILNVQQNIRFLWIVERPTFPGPAQALWIVPFTHFRQLFSLPHVVFTQLNTQMRPFKNLQSTLSV